MNNKLTLTLSILFISGCTSIGSEFNFENDVQFPRVGDTAIYTTHDGSLELRYQFQGEFSNDLESYWVQYTLVGQPEIETGWIEINKKSNLPIKILMDTNEGTIIKFYDHSANSYVLDYLFNVTGPLVARAYAHPASTGVPLESDKNRIPPSTSQIDNGIRTSFSFPQFEKTNGNVTWRTTWIAYEDKFWPSKFGELIGLSAGLQGLKLDRIEHSEITIPDLIEAQWNTRLTSSGRPPYDPNSALTLSLDASVGAAEATPEYQEFLQRFPNSKLFSASYLPQNSLGFSEWSLAFIGTTGTEDFPDWDSIEFRIIGANAEILTWPVVIESGRIFGVAGPEYPIERFGLDGEIHISDAIHEFMGLYGIEPKLSFRISPEIFDFKTSMEQSLRMNHPNSFDSITYSMVSGKLLEVRISSLEIVY